MADFNLSEHQCKFAPMYFLPRWLHLSDGLHHILVLLTSNLCNL